MTFNIPPEGTETTSTVNWSPPGTVSVPLIVRVPSILTSSPAASKSSINMTELVFIVKLLKALVACVLIVSLAVPFIITVPVPTYEPPFSAQLPETWIVWPLSTNDPAVNVKLPAIVKVEEGAVLFPEPEIVRLL